MPSKNDSEAVRRERVRQLWEARSAKERTATYIVIFCEWLAEHFPELLPSGQGDPYQHLKVDLDGLILPKPKQDDRISN